MKGFILYRLGWAFSFVWLMVLLMIHFTGTANSAVCFKASEPGMPLIFTERCGDVGGGTEFLPSPGNAHAVNHGNKAKREGIGVCIPCHDNGSAVVEFDKFICSQYDFKPEGRKVPDGNGGFVTDPISGDEIVSGDGIAVLLTGDIITCEMCHYPHDTPGFKAEDYLVHQGCLGCHEEVGSDDLIESDDDPQPSNDPTGFVKEPWGRLCNDCHGNKRWGREGHKKHEEKRVACTKCHTFN